MSTEPVLAPAPSKEPAASRPEDSSGGPSPSGRAAADVPAVVARARAAQRAWAELSVDARVQQLGALKDRILDRAESIAAVVHEEVGKPEVEALLGEVLPSADVVQYWTGAIGELLEPSPVALDWIAYPGKDGTLHREPRGVVAVIMPWNFPVALPLRTIIPALLAGDAVVFKPSEVTPRSGALLADLFEGIVPEGLVGLVLGAGDVGAELCAADVDLVVFTGSVATGRKVAHACAEKLVPCSLELGGKDAAIVLADANLDRAANGVVWGAMMNAGQNCASVERVYVEKAVAEEFTRKVVAAVGKLREADVGPLATDAQHAIVARHVEDAKQHGAKVLAGGADKEGSARAYLPTVVRVESDDLALMRDETFGPVLPIAVVEGADEAVARANASRYGLTASVWTRKRERGEALARKLRAGVVTINNHSFTGAIPAAPWSGVGETGWGITSSPLALDALTRPRFVLADRGVGRSELWWYPYTPALRAIALSMAIVRSGARGIVEKAKAVFALIRAMITRGRELR
jgi:acyl-CoA reductase-like NAD-dependent aldehyde dehydrogenase